MQYFYRAKLAASRQPPERRLTWLESLDQDERADWVSAFRDSAKPLGLVIQETMQKRDAHWMAQSRPQAQVSLTNSGQHLGDTSPGLKKGFDFHPPIPPQSSSENIEFDCF